MPYVQKEDGYHYTEEEPVATTVVTPQPNEQQLPPVDPKLTKLEQDLAEQKRVTQSLQASLNRQQTPPPQPGTVSIEDLNKQFFKDPVTTAVAIAQQAAAEAVARSGEVNFDTLVGVARDKARAKNPELFDKYADEIAQTVNTTVDRQFHTNSTVWENAAHIAYGKHMNEIRDLARQTQPQASAIRVSEGGPVAPGGHQPEAPKGAASKLSDEELTMAKRLNVDPELYAKGKADYDNQPDKGKSSWDTVVTFDSRDKRRIERAKRRAAAAK